MVDRKNRPSPLNMAGFAPPNQDNSVDDNLGNLSLLNLDDKKDDRFAVNLDTLETLGELGSGNGGYVTKCRLPNGQVIAKKTIRIEVNAAERARILKELEVLKDCDSEFIVKYFGNSYRNGEIYLFMEYMDGRSLDAILGKTTRIPEEVLGKITISVVKGLTYLRDKLNVMHRDIKPSNILVNSSGQIKLCDFGVSGQLIDSMAKSFVGTRNYMSPERLHGLAYRVESDIWSLGLTLVELALGVYPVPQHDPERMYLGERSPEANKMPIFALMECVVNEPPPTVPGPPYFSTDFKDFIDRCLKKRPEDRPDLRSILELPFFVNAERSKVAVDFWVCQVCTGSAPELQLAQSVSNMERTQILASGQPPRTVFTQSRTSAYH